METKKLEKISSKQSAFLPEADVPENLRICIENIVKKNGYVTYSVNIRDMSTTGDNYLGELFGVDVTGETTDGSKNTSIFVKQTIPADKVNILSVSEVYNNEVFAYTDLFRVIHEVQNEAKIPEAERFRTVKAYDESNSQIIILDNLAVKGYKTLPRMAVMPLKFAELSIEQLARFHGMNFALQKCRPNYFESKVKTKKHPFEIDNLQEVIESCGSRAVNMLEGEAKEKANAYLVNICDKLSSFVSNDVSTVTCLGHGDYKVSNMLIRETNGEISDVIAVDYQLIYNTNPMNDFFYFIFVGTDREFRNKHLNHLKELYFKSLTKILSYFSIHVENVYPRKVFETDFKERLEYGLVISLLFLPLMFVMEDDFPDISKQSFGEIVLNIDGRFKKRIQEIVDDFIAWGYL